jgi:Protein of unknown function (DUF3618).
MGQTTDQIAAHIEHTRDSLGSNLDELEQRVKSVADWQRHFRSNPLTMLGVAFGGGVMLAAMFGGHQARRGRSVSSHSSGSDFQVVTDQDRLHALKTWDHIKGALIGVAASRFTEFVGEIVPGFTDEFQRTAMKASAPQSSRASQQTSL